jgi:hypothetical protein
MSALSRALGRLKLYNSVFHSSCATLSAPSKQLVDTKKPLVTLLKPVGRQVTLAHANSG